LTVLIIPKPAERFYKCQHNSSLRDHVISGVLRRSLGRRRSLKLTILSERRRVNFEAAPMVSVPATMRLTADRSAPYFFTLPEPSCRKWHLQLQSSCMPGSLNDYSRTFLHSLRELNDTIGVVKALFSEILWILQKLADHVVLALARWLRNDNQEIDCSNPSRLHEIRLLTAMFSCKDSFMQAKNERVTATNGIPTSTVGSIRFL